MSGIQAHMKIALVTGANKGIGREVALNSRLKDFTCSLVRAIAVRPQSGR
jgi:NAD(P)-dependent dehydrogenase (short-subunit alcohol dehydrogenase family)